MAGAYVAGNAVAAIAQVIERSNMGTCQVFNMDVVAHACAIGSGVVVSEHFELWCKTEKCLHDMWDEIL